MVNINNIIKSKTSNHFFFKYLLIIFIVIPSIVIISFILINENIKYKQSLLSKHHDPSWIYELIENSKNDHMFPISSITKCYYKSKIVYLIGNNIPDSYSVLYDEQKNTVCNFGGISGQGDGKCPNFDKVASCITIYRSRL